MGDFKVAVFNLNGEQYGVDTLQINEIVKYQGVVIQEEMPSFIDGVYSLRGSIVSVIDLNRRFGLGNTEITKKTKIIITSFDTICIGFIVNDVSEILTFSENEIDQPSEVLQKIKKGYLRMVVRKGNRLISIIEFKGILNKSEIDQLGIIK